MADKPAVDSSALEASPFAKYGLLLALLCAAAGIISGLGYRLGWWPLRVGFGVMRWSAYLAIAAAVISLIGAVAARPGGKQRGLALALAGLAVSIAAFGWPAIMQYRAKHLPPIHDITTDTSNPPKFVAVLPLRAGAANPAEYQGPEVAVQQRKAYPQLVPLETKAPPAQEFSRALATARAMGWTIIAAVPAEGRIEATDTTLLYGFKDDVVVRVTPTANGSRVDVRSESRIGKSDMGTNARRITAFLDKLAKSAWVSPRRVEAPRKISHSERHGPSASLSLVVKAVGLHDTTLSVLDGCYRPNALLRDWARRSANQG